MTDFPFGNNPSPKPIFVILSEIPKPQDPRLDLTWWSDHDIRTSFPSESMMMSTPSGLKEKQKTPEGLGIPTDWHVRAINQPTEESLAVLDLPFETIPEVKDTVPSKFTERVRHLVGGQDIVIRIDSKEVSKKAPFTGYYACFKGALLALSNVFGVWFKICLWAGNTYECFRLARPSLQLKDSPMKGINYT